MYGCIKCSSPVHTSWYTIHGIMRQKRPVPNTTIVIMTSSNGSIFRVTGLLCWEFTGNRWIPLTKASATELWCFLWSAPEPIIEQTRETPVICDAVAVNMTSLQCLAASYLICYAAVGTSQCVVRYIIVLHVQEKIWRLRWSSETILSNIHLTSRKDLQQPHHPSIPRNFEKDTYRVNT